MGFNRKRDFFIWLCIDTRRTEIWGWAERIDHWGGVIIDTSAVNHSFTLYIKYKGVDQLA